MREAFGIEPLGHHSSDVGSDQFGRAQFGTDAAAETLEPEHHPHQQREVSRKHQPVLVHHRGPAREDRGDVEVPDTGEEVTVQPDVDVRPQLRTSTSGGGVRHFQDRVGDLVGVVRADRDDKVFELRAARRAT